MAGYFFAGDAAHTHSPAGAQGMNTGLQDAFHLGWKLSAALAGWAPEWLLDSYHAERHRVGAAVLALTAWQLRLNTARTRRRRALRWGVQQLAVPPPGVRSWLARNYSGISVRYPVTDGGHPMTGARLPPGHLTLPGGSVTRLYELFHDGRFVLLSPDGVPDGPPGCVKTCVMRAARPGCRAPCWSGRMGTSRGLPLGVTLRGASRKLGPPSRAGAAPADSGQADSGQADSGQADSVG